MNTKPFASVTGRLITFVLAVLLLAACGDDEEKPAPPSIDPALIAGAVAHARGRVDLEGGVIRLAGSRDGLIVKVAVEEGDRVSKNQVLAVIDDRRAQLNLEVIAAELKRAQAAHAGALVTVVATRREFERLSALTARDVATGFELDQARDRHDLALARERELAAEVEILTRRQTLDMYEVEQHTVRAPLDGWIVRRDARLGDGVSTTNVTPLFLFAPEAPRIIRAELDERFVEAVQPGMNAEVVLDADPTRRFPGTVLRLGQVFGAVQPTGDPSELPDVRVIECVLALEDQSLRIGQRVLVRILPSSDRPQPEAESGSAEGAKSQTAFVLTER